jgi:hypothetical protein
VHARAQGTAVANVATGSISGTVTRAGTPTPIADVVVRVFDSSGWNVNQATTDAAGAYTVSGLGTGRYFAVASNSADVYIDELYLDSVCLNPWSCGVTSGTPIPVTDGVDTPGIDFGLEIGGYVMGHVWEDVTFALLSSGITIAAYDTHGYVASTATPRASDSQYIVFGLPTGDYFVGAWDSTKVHVSEIHDGIPATGILDDVFEGTPVHVVVDDPTPSVGFGLAVAGSIEGTVTEQGTGTPIAGAFVEVYDGEGTRVLSGNSTGSGTYTLSGVPSGTYFATCSDPSRTHVLELWDEVDLPCPPCDVTTGTPITVTEPSPTTGIDFDLANGGRISGTVTVEGSGAPLQSAVVYVHDDIGRQVDIGLSAADGTYTTFGAVPTGSYYVIAYGPTGEYIPEVYPGTQCLSCSPTTGTPVAVTMGEDTTGIDFSLVTGGQITGAATIEGWGDPLSDGTVYIYDGGGSLVGSGYMWQGVYETSTGLPTGTYFATALGPAAGVGLQGELFDDFPCPQVLCTPTTGTPVDVTAPDPTANVDFDLPLGGRIQGFVADAGSGAPLLGMTVSIHDAGGVLVGAVTSGSHGEFATDGLANGTYYALAEDNTGAGYASELYDNTPCDGCDVTTGTPIVISSTSPHEGIDFGLSVPSVCSGETHLDLTSTSPAGGTETYEACETITAGGTFGVQSPGDVQFRAGLQIILTDGFFVESGSAATFEIDPALLP